MNRFALKKELEYCAKKLNTLIKGKANVTHTHSLDDVTETESKKILTQTERENITKVNNIVDNTGDGTKVLYDDGTYKEPGAPDLIDDTNSLSDKTYSSTKIDEELSKKAGNFDNDTLLRALTQTDVNKLHEHSNKAVLDSITEQNVSDWNAGGHGHDNKTVLDNVTQSVIDNTHTHTNKTILDNITQDKIDDWDSKISHSHDNKEALDKVINSGAGTKVLTDNGTYVDDVRTWSDVIDKPFKSLDSELFTTDSNGKLALKYPAKEVTLTEYNAVKYNPITDMIYIVHDVENGKNAIYLNKIKYAEVNDSSILIDNGDGTKFLNDKREYAVPNYSAVIKDTTSGTETTYSSEKIEARLDEVQYDISHGVEGNLTLYQRTILNATNGDVKYFETSNSSAIYKAVLQAYKFVEGEQNITEIIKNYDNTDAENFNYNSETVDFGEDGMKIKDTYTLTYSREGDYYISEPFNKDDFIELNSISI